MRISPQGRGFQRMGIANRLRVGDTCRFKGQDWKVVGSKASLEQAEALKKSREDYNEKLIEKYGIGGLHGHVKAQVYAIRKMKRTLNYGSIVRFEYLLISREIEAQE